MQFKSKSSVWEFTGRLVWLVDEYSHGVYHNAATKCREALEVNLVSIK